MQETVHEVPLPAIAGFPASNLESHINHLLFETDMNQRERTWDNQRASSDIMTESASASGIWLKIQQLDLNKTQLQSSLIVKVTCCFPAIITADMNTDQISGY